MIIYYVRDKENKPRITVAVERILDDGEFVLARGMSLCSMKDNPNKKTGRTKAIGLLNKAIKTMRDCHNTRILRDEALEVLDNCHAISDFSNEPPDMRCEYNAVPWNDLEFRFLMDMNRNRRKMDA